MPISNTFSLRRIEVVFFDLNGNVLTELETDVLERVEAMKQYAKAIENGETATLAETSEKYVKIHLGNFPANSKAYLRAYCS